jgi:hypothetical protein
MTTTNIDWQDTLETALKVPGSFGSTYTRFHTYSFLNQVLLYSQGCNEPCASYKTWQDMGRQVRAGTHGYLINKPITKKRRGAKEDDKDATYTSFVLVRGAHPYSHTDGDDLPAYEPAGWSLDKALAELDITRVPFESTNGNMQGYAFKRSLAINPVAVYPLKTTMHELAHIVLGHTDNATPEALRHKGIAEFQAEATAYLLMRELDSEDHFNADESRAYIQYWLRDTEVTDKAIRQVFTTVTTILKAGR